MKITKYDTMFDEISPMLLTDFYKTVHHIAYKDGLTTLVSYWTPRMTRIPEINKVVMCGLQPFIKKYLIHYFNKYFFSVPKEIIMEDYRETIADSMNVQASNPEFIEKLHDLGYLPISVRAVNEGKRVNVKTPMMEIKNTHPDFAWIVNYFETLFSCNIWQAMTSASIAYYYREIVENSFKKTVAESCNIKATPIGDGRHTFEKLSSAIKIPAKKHLACGDFSMRGMSSPESAMLSGSAHLTSFVPTATIPALKFINRYYPTIIEGYVIGKGTPSMEHSVMETYGKSEYQAYKTLITEKFPTGNLSIVSDTYDYWNILTEIIPSLKEDIMNRDGKILVRGDSGDPIDIICGTFGKQSGEIIENYPELSYKDIVKFFKKKASKDFKYQEEASRKYWIRINDGSTYIVKCHYTWVDDEESSMGGYTSEEVSDVEITQFIQSVEEKGTVELLWDIFGGYINEKGYKVLNPHIGTIYGDSITPERAKAIYARLEAKGFAANNCVLGIGSFTYQYNTRDTFGFALKATHAVINGIETQIYKEPKTDSGNFKKSQKGLCYVYEADGEILYKDQLSFEEINSEEYADNLLEEVFVDGVIVKEFSFDDVRKNLHGNNFWD